jgi:hypothetical protein
MNSRLDEFRGFVNRHPKLRDEVRNGSRTWQSIYEEWVLYGEDNPDWRAYQATNQSNNNINLESIRNIVGALQKLNPDSIYQTLNTAQKFLQILQSFGGKSRPTPYIRSPYDEWWD